MPDRAGVKICLICIGLYIYHYIDDRSLKCGPKYSSYVTIVTQMIVRLPGEIAFEAVNILLRCNGKCQGPT